jgi:hypothetical protein
VFTQDKVERVEGEDRLRIASKEKALQEADDFREEGKLAGVGDVAEPSSYVKARACLKQGFLPPPESILEEDFTARFPAPYSEDVRRLAGMLALALKGGEKTSGADFEMLLKHMEGKKSAIRMDREVLGLIWMIETSAKIKMSASPKAGTGQDGFVPEPRP